jgi:hypothetical protein
MALCRFFHEDTGFHEGFKYIYIWFTDSEIIQRPKPDFYFYFIYLFPGIKCLPNTGFFVGGI